MGLQYSSPSCVASDPSPTGTASSGSPHGSNKLRPHLHISIIVALDNKETNKQTKAHTIT